MRRMCRVLVCACAGVALYLVPAISTAAPPAINNISLRGLQAGAKTTIVIDGSDLLPEPVLLTTLPGVNATVKPGATEARAEFEVEVQTAMAGIRALRLANKKGISNAVLIGVDALPQIVSGAKGTETPLTSLPVAVTGNLAGSEVDRYTFQGQAGQRLVIDVEARRLGANFSPIVRLLDGRGTQVAFARGEPRLVSDARVATTLKESGTYTLELQDLSYRAGSPGFYRIKIGDLNYIDFVLPLGITAGAKSQLAGFGSPPQRQTELTPSADEPPGLGTFADLAKPGVIGSTAIIAVSNQPEVLHSNAEKPQELPAAPVGASGVIGAPGEEDRFVLPVNPEQKLRFDLMAARFGSPLDGALTLTDEKGNQLATADDQPGSTDPGLDYTVPKNVNKIVLKVGEHQRLGGADFVYRLVVRDLARPDFTLALDSDRVNIPSGSVEVIKVDVVRSNYAGPIKLEVENLPPGIEVSGAEIPAKTNSTLLSLRAPGGVSGSGVISILGRATEAQPPLVRRALAAETPATKLAPWLRNDVGVGITGAPRLAVNWTLAADDKLTPGGKYTAKLQLTRSAAGQGPVRFKMLTTQPPVKKKEKKDNKEVEVDDVMKVIRLENVPEIAVDATEATLTVAIPAELAEQVWGIAFTAELLDAEKKNVTSSATTGMKFLTAVKSPEAKAEPPKSEPPKDPAAAKVDDKAKANAKAKEKLKAKPAKSPKPKKPAAAQGK